MSINQKLSALVFFGIVCGWGFSSFYESTRAPASLPAPKLRLKPWAHSTSGKLQEAISVKVYAVSGLPENDSQELTLRAEVTLNRPLDTEAEWQWVLPEEAKLISGEVTDSWPGLEVGQTATTEISLVGVSKEGSVKTVSFMVHGNSGSIKFGGAGHFATNTYEPPVETEEFQKLEVKDAKSLLKNKIQQ